MRQWLAIGVGLAVGVAVMLAVLQPWKKEEALPMAPPPPTPQMDRLPEARRLILEGKLDEARDLLKKAPPSALAYALLALADVRAADPASARENLSKAAHHDPGLFELSLYQGHLDMITGDIAAAQRSYTEALKRKPKDPAALAGRAAARFELKEYAGAIEDATAAMLAADPDDPGALFTRAAAYNELGRQEESLRDWTAYLARRPRDAQAWMNRGNVHARMGRKSGAATDWEQAVVLEPTLKDVLAPLITEAKRP